MFRHYHHLPRFRGHASQGSYTAKQIAALYNFPAGTTGKGTKAGIISLGGDFSQADADAYSKLLGIPASTITVHPIGGAARVSDPGGADVENMLDAECVHGAAPGAEVHAFLAPNTDVGFVAAVTAAVAFGVDGISCSWGAPEAEWTTPSKVAFDKALALAAAASIPFFAAAGDNGSSDGDKGLNVDYPASSIYSIGCGGTTITGTAPLAQKVWNDGTQGGATGGGLSANFARPAFQAKIPTQGGTRVVPDIALNADPESGYLLIVAGQQEVVGGTSGAAPTALALYLRLKEALGKAFDFRAAAYSLQSAAFTDITIGNNGNYTARPGFDPCTGNGTPDGTKLLAALAPVAPPAPTPDPVPVPVPTPSPVPASYSLTLKSASPISVA